MDKKPSDTEDGSPCREHGLLTTGDMARLTGSTVRTIRFYEEEGLIASSSRTCGGHRMFEEETLGRLTFILDFREAGLSLEAIRRLFELKAQANTPGTASHEMSLLLETQITEMHQKISKLERLRSELGRMVESIRDCGKCAEPEFPKRCGECSVMTQCGLPRVMKLLWK